MANDDRLVAGIELGGTKGIALIARGSTITEQARVPTTTPDETLAALSDHLKRWEVSHGKAEAIGIASFGPVGLTRGNTDYGHISATPKPGWANTDVVGHFADGFGVPIGFDTDVAGAALAEYRWGAAQGCQVAVYLTIGTGIGGGVIVDGEPVHGLIHPEIGHILVRRAPGDDFAGVCEFHGDCIEGLASGPAIAARAGEPGDGLSDDNAVWAMVTGEIAQLMAILMLTVSPERIIIGGGVLGGREALFPKICAKTADLLGTYLAGVDTVRLGDIIVPPTLGDRAGPLGAVALAYRA